MSEEKNPRATILLVDDYDDSRDLLALQLRMDGYRVLEASDGGEALAVLSQVRPDLVLMDLSMPALDGLSATCRLREIPEMRDVPVVALTAHSPESHREAALAAGCDEFVAKTIGADELRRVVSRLLSEERGGVVAGRRVIASKGMDSDQLLDAIERHLSRG
ncbi:MAG: hypothetical protein DMF66_17375 [Acidobacteria bacterium]|nr:MAG: hypothetical protein DMF66_17375 [Acidobacteriota bacterium]